MIDPDDTPFVIDASKFMAEFPDFYITSIREGIEASLEWQRERGGD